MSLSTRLASGLALAVAVLACSNPASVLQWQSYAAQHVALRKVAVVPLYTGSEFVAGEVPHDIDGATAADLVGRFLTEAIAERGRMVVAPSDLALAFTRDGRDTPRRDPQAAAEVAAAEFGATGVLLGTVSRYRERTGEALGALRPASVAFEVTLYAAPGGEKLWGARFDQTQETLMANPLKASRYPGGGLRWLTAGEFARWGVTQMAKVLFSP